MMKDYMKIMGRDLLKEYNNQYSDRTNNVNQTKYMYTVSKGNPCVWWAGDPPNEGKLINQYLMLGIRWKEYDGELLLDYEELDKDKS